LFAKVPETIILMLFVLTIASAFLAGYSNKKGKMDWAVAIGFSILSAFVIFITLDLDRPRTGLIRLDIAEQTMLDLRQSVK
jgi:cytochrome c oxidase subunit IV